MKEMRTTWRKGINEGISIEKHRSGFQSLKQRKRFHPATQKSERSAQFVQSFEFWPEVCLQAAVTLTFYWPPPKPIQLTLSQCWEKSMFRLWRTNSLKIHASGCSSENERRSATCLPGCGHTALVWAITSLLLLFISAVWGCLPFQSSETFGMRSHASSVRRWCQRAWGGCGIRRYSGSFVPRILYLNPPCLIHHQPSSFHTWPCVGDGPSDVLRT